MRRAVTIGAWLVAFALVAEVAADKIDTLTSALLTDGSYRVRVQAALTLGKLKVREGRAVQALVEALRDDNEGVRAVAAAALGKIRDPAATDALRALAGSGSKVVRAQAEKALAEIQHAPGGSSVQPARRARYFLSVSPLDAGKADPASAKRIQDRALLLLGRIDGVTLDENGGAPLRFQVESRLTNLSVSPPDPTGKVKTECDARLIVATHPEKSIKMMATVGGSIDGTSDPSDIEASRSACLDDMAQQIAEKVQSFLETQR